jgi:anaerobic ribonucleoside-triphosphate reductase activating protein
VQLSVGQIVEDTEAEGPGRRFALWTQGCSLRCPGCCNPHLFSERGGQNLEIRDLLTRIAAVKGIEGVSVLGGEPFDQREALAELCAGVQALGLSVMVFSGYTLSQLGSAKALEHIDILVDGPFVKEQPETVRRWIGSANQGLYFLTPRGLAEAGRFTAGNTVEIRLKRGELAVNGWPGAHVVGRW